MASLTDLKLIQLTRQAAQQALNQDLITPALETRLTTFQRTTHLE